MVEGSGVPEPSFQRAPCRIPPNRLPISSEFLLCGVQQAASARQWMKIHRANVWGRITLTHKSWYTKSSPPTRSVKNLAAARSS